MINFLPTLKHSTQPARNRRAVALCVDSAYLPYASFVASQILEKETTRDFDIVICLPDTDKIPASTREDIRYCTVDFSVIDGLPVGRLSSATYHKIFLPALFKDEYEQILYLDADVYVSAPCISQILDSNQEGKGLMMAIDISEIERKSGFNFHNAYLNRYIALKHQYRNAGVILFNTKRLLEIGYLEKMMAYARKNRQKLLRHDQTLINTVLYDEIGSLSFLYNYQLIDTTIPLSAEFQPKIFHFVGELKPWNTEHGFIGSFHTEYERYIGQHFPAHQITSKTEFELKYESRKKKRKYKNVIRERMSLGVFVGKEKLKHVLSFFDEKSPDNVMNSPKIRQIVSRFRSTIDTSIYECEMGASRV
ncbi:glycosyltransferase family 8 protein [Sphingobacterium gobiense]|uniref:Glycosyltransferase family 8 protein n=1 Tax=Sphingobacterium gobiense TaxID=1382456 RepID=A0A2S9JMT2_9SPHI|nr:glycosyltransferase [Sphingobacterium gobiense]PRD54428.1 hypothetical protein C5749_13280 [Sphingobacterium gobiense]